MQGRLMFSNQLFCADLLRLLAACVSVVCPYSFLLWLAANGEIFLSHFFYCLLSRSGFLVSCFSYLDSLSTCVWEPQQYMTTVAAMTSFADHGASLQFSFFSTFWNAVLLSTTTLLWIRQEKTKTLQCCPLTMQDMSLLASSLLPVPFSHQRVYLTGK
jgi:hypothetical protein